MDNHITYDSPFYKEVKRKLDNSSERADILLSDSSLFINKWIDGKRVCEILYISKRTLQNYRDNGILPYSNVTGKFYYNLDDIARLLERNYVPAM